MEKNVVMMIVQAIHLHLTLGLSHEPGRIRSIMRKQFFTGIGLMACVILGTWPLGSFGQEEFPGNPKNGQNLYEKHCANCHGEKGTGDGRDTKFLTVQPANFHSLDSRSKTDEELLSIITYGTAFSPMHGWANRLTEEERWDILRYIRLLAPFNPVVYHQPQQGRGIG